jgi:hypothetical protein
MFQNYDVRGGADQGRKAIPLIRAQLEQLGLDGLFVPHEDEWQNEYLPDCAERLAWATGFTGSAGAAVILSDKAYLFSDGRYTQQALSQTAPELFEQRDLVDQGPAVWLKAEAPSGAKIGYINGSGTGSQEYGSLAFSTATTAFGAITERMRINADGNVGIGTSSPTVPLSVTATTATILVKSTSSGTNAVVAVDNTGTDGASLFRTDINGTTTGYIGAGGATYPNLGGNNSLFLWNVANGPAVFATNNTERMRITSSGNVGIGNTDAAYPLDVNGAIRSRSISPPIAFARGLSFYYENASIADDATAITLVSTAGYIYHSSRFDITVINGDDIETMATVGCDAKETTVASANLGGLNSANIAVVNGTTGTDDKFNILLNAQSGNGYIAIRNRMGGTRRVYMTVTIYSTR